MIEEINISGSKYTPEITYNHQNKTLVISGKCLPEDSIEFFTPLNKWIQNFKQSPSNLTIDIKLLYFNTASSKVILECLKTLVSASDKVKINWKYLDEDEDLEEFGMMLKGILGNDKVVLNPVNE